MGKTAFVFSGQGAQSSGMGKSLFESYPELNELVKEAEKSGVDVLKLVTQASEEDLSKTINAQPAIFAMSLAGYTILKNKGINISAMAGFSLGECSALAASGVLSLKDGFTLIKERALIMQKAAEESSGAMFAIIGLDNEKLEKICKEQEGFCEPVNFNCPNQTVIAGEEKAAINAADKAVKAGALKAVRLNVNAAFHTNLMLDASNSFKEKILTLEYNKPFCTLYSNVTGKPLDKDVNIPEYLVRQMTSAVKWQACIENMIKDGIDTFVEIGPGKTLTGLIRRIDRSVKTYNIYDEKSINDFLTEIN